MAGEGGLLVGYGGCGRPGLGLGCAESLPGVPRLYEYQRFLEDVKTISVYQKLTNQNGSICHQIWGERSDLMVDRYHGP